MRMHSNQMLEMAREAIELVILRSQCQVAAHGPQQHLFNRIRDLSEAIDLIDGCSKVVSVQQYPAFSDQGHVALVGVSEPAKGAPKIRPSLRAKRA